LTAPPDQPSAALPEPELSAPKGPETHASSSLREDILQAATELFAARGYRGTSIRAVVEAVGCTKPSLYYYFGSKDALYVEAIRRPLVGLAELVSSTIADTAPFPVRLCRFIEAAFSSAAERPAAIRLTMSLHHRPQDGGPKAALDLVETNPIVLFRDLVADGQARGELRADVDPSVLASAIAALTGHFIFLITIKGEPPAEGTASRIVDLLLHGAAP
jgi:AcrR family transcriptional regulator